MKMTEVNRLKFYFARYFFLALAILQLLTAAVILLQASDSPKNRFAIFVFAALAMILFSIHWLVSEHLKQVVIDKKKITVVYSHKVKQFDWNDVKELKHLAFLNVYSLKLKGKRRRIYFLPDIDQAALFGLFNGGLQFANKK
jgi:hypothetical protein